MPLCRSSRVVEFPPVPSSGRGRLQLLPPMRMSADAADPEHLLTVSDLRQGAVHLAAVELNHHPGAARRRPAAWYREAWGPELCSAAEAAVVREMTIETCVQARVLQDYARRMGPARPGLTLALVWNRLANRLTARGRELRAWVGKVRAMPLREAMRASLDFLAFTAAMLYIFVVAPLLVKGCS